MKQTIILGNIITVDQKRPYAKAAVVKNGVFSYIGSAEEAKKIAGPDAEVMDYGENFIYPGFLESHCHPYFAGDRLVGQANLGQVGLADYAKYREIIKDFIADNPDRSYYMAAGWNETEEYVSKAYLDEICSDKILIMQTGGGHSMLLNSKALAWAGIDAEYARKVGYAQVHVDEKGEPDGYICETPVLRVLDHLPKSMEDAKRYLLAWQDFALSSGFTGVADAGLELFYPECAQAFHELEEEGKLKLRTYAYALSPDNVEDPKAEVARAAELRARYDSDYFHIVGIKCFLDGVTEAHTGWQNQDYADQPGYHGVERFNSHDKMVQLIVEADKEGFAVHCHSEGGGATHFMLGCIEDAIKITGDRKQYNVLAHLHYVTEEDIRRMAETGSIPAVPPLWAVKIPAAFAIESSYVGEKLANKAYPIKSFFDAGANVVFHSDYPVSPMMSVKLSFYMAEARNVPEELFPGLGAVPLNPSEAVTREQALEAMTINIARAWHQEHRIGSIEFGKIANMTVCDCDFLHDGLDKVAAANIIATIVDGKEAFKAE
jgi:predicted amidohydrolase YtcJ